MNIHQFKQYLFNNIWYGEQGKAGRKQLHPSAIYSLVLPDAARIWGPDISHWDGNVNLSITKERGASFVFIKAIDGTIQNAYFASNRQRAKDAGLLHAPYGWLYRNVNVSCIAQAQAYTNIVQKYPSDLPPVIDFEPTRYAGVQSNPTYDDLRKWAMEWLRLGNRKAILYSAAYYMNPLGQIPSDLKAMFEGFWVANYGVVNPLMPYGYTQNEWLFHQFTSSGDASYLAPNDTNKLELDLNYWKDDRQSLYTLAGVPPVSNDVVTYPFDGVKRITGRRNGSDFILNFLDPQKIRFEVVHDSNLRRPSSFAIERGADFAWNGDVWNKYEPAPYKPMGFAVSNSEIIMWRASFVPSLDLPTADIFYEGERGTQVTSGFRYIVQNSRPKSYLSGTSEEYTDVHPRSAKGVDVNGHIMMLTVDGRTAENRGMTLLELANLLCEFQCATAFDSDSGGSSVDVMNGIVRNKPSDGTERPVVQTILAYAGETMATVKHWTARTIELTKVRDMPAGNELSYKIPLGTNIEADLENGNWLHVIIPSQYVGWVNKSSLTNILEKLVVVDEPPPPAPTLETVVNITLKTDGTVIGTWTEQ